MKILITTDLFRPAINGVVTSVLNLERELEKNGHEVKILAVSDTCSTYQMENVYYIRSVPAKIYPDVRIPVSRGRAYVQEIIAVSYTHLDVYKRQRLPCVWRRLVVRADLKKS